MGTATEIEHTDSTELFNAPPFDGFIVAETTVDID